MWMVVVPLRDGDGVADVIGKTVVRTGTVAVVVIPGQLTTPGAQAVTVTILVVYKVSVL
jgi:hypothetical protein